MGRVRTRLSAGLSKHAFLHPLLASAMAYGNVALVSASVLVLGTPPGMFVTP